MDPPTLTHPISHNLARDRNSPLLTCSSSPHSCVMISSITPCLGRLLIEALFFPSPCFFDHGDRCSKYRLQDFPRLHRYFHRILALPGVKQCIDIEGIKLMYYLHQGFRARAGVIVPPGPEFFIQGPLVHAHSDSLMSQPGFVLSASLCLGLGICLGLFAKPYLSGLSRL